jgi:hypothetical protein
MRRCCAYNFSAQVSNRPLFQGINWLFAPPTRPAQFLRAQSAPHCSGRATARPPRSTDRLGLAQSEPHAGSSFGR